MKNKIYFFFGGRVGGVCPPYRDHSISKIIMVSGGLDMPFAIAQGYSTTGDFYK
jgi:hypothetical protein